MGSGAVPFQVQWIASDADLDACSDDMFTIPVSGRVRRGSTDGLDSFSIELPLGVDYVPGSYMDINNVVMSEPMVTSNATTTFLTWPFADLSRGDNLSFSVDVAVTDQSFLECGELPYVISGFSTEQDVCEPTGEVCMIANVTSQLERSIDISKANLIFNNFGASAVLDAAAGTADISFDIEVCNTASTLVAGSEIVIQVYSDVDCSNTETPVDTVLTSITHTLVADLLPGSCVDITPTLTVDADGFCKLYGVLDPDFTCSCSEDISDIISPDLDLAFDGNYTVCSGADVLIGPDPTSGYTYEWLSFNGSDLALLSETDTTMVTFSQTNTTGAAFDVEYRLRASVQSCFVLDTITITVFPETGEEFDLAICDSVEFMLPAPTPGGSNFIWMPTTGLSFPGPDSGFAVVDVVPNGISMYTLTYLDSDGCPATNVYNLTGLDCGTTMAAIGDTVWFDFDQDGFQEMGEPGIGGVLVTLIDALTGAVFSTTTTDANGYYLFPNLPPFRTWIVDFDFPPGFVPTIQNAGSGPDSLIDSDADPTTGLTGPYFIETDTNLTADAGFIPDCMLELDVIVDPCLATDSGAVSPVRVIVSWTGNPYTYDQFGGQDILNISAFGTTIPVIADTLFGDTTLTFYAGSSFPQGTFVNAHAAFDLADACIDFDSTTTISDCIYDLALIKTATNGPTFSYGDTVCMQITVTNQGTQPATGIEITDYLPDGYLFLPDMNLDWFDFGAFVTTTLDTTLLEDEFVNVPLKVEVLRDGTDYLNIAEISNFQDTSGNDIPDLDIDSTPDRDPTNDPGGQVNSPSDDVIDGDGTNGGGSPGDTDPDTDEDDADPYIIDLFDLALRKTLITPSPYAFGDELTFRIVVFNQGTTPATNVGIKDYIPGGFSFNASSSSGWTEAGGGICAVDTITSVILPKDSVVRFITLNLEESTPDMYINRAEITVAEDTTGIVRDDVDSTPDDIVNNDPGGNPGTDSDNSIDGDGTGGGGSPGDTDPDSDEDDEDPAYVAVPLIEIVKTQAGTVPAASGVPGNYDVTFHLVIENAGNQKLSCIELEDDLANELGNRFVQLVVGPMIIADSTNADSLPNFQAGYDGVTEVRIFDGGSGCLSPAQMIGVEIVVEISSNFGFDPIINSSATAGKDSFFTPTDDMDTALVELPRCYLDVTCPNPNQGIYECIADIPPLATTIDSFNAIDGFSQLNDTCGAVSFMAFETMDEGTGCVDSALTITRTYIFADTVKFETGEPLVDTLGNPIVLVDTCVVMYVIEDETPPTLICPGPATTACTIDSVPVFASLDEFILFGGFVEDACGVDTFGFVQDSSDGMTCPETVFRTYFVRDSCGNESRCNQVITINDDLPPQVICVPLDSECAQNLADPYPNGTPGLLQFLAAGSVVLDNCGIDSASFTFVDEISDGNTCPEIRQRKYTILDLCGNIAEGLQLITLDDETPPVLSGNVPADVTIYCPDVPAAAPTLTATDNCGVATVVFDEVSTQTDNGTCSDDQYTITRTWTATDSCGNEDQEIQIITVLDTTAPVITTPAVDTCFACEGGSLNIGAVVDWLAGNAGSVAVDDCSDVTWSNDWSFSAAADSCGIDGATIQVVFTASDACGNSVNDTVEVCIIADPCLNVEKFVTQLPTNNGDGSFTLEYTVRVENCGNVELDSVQVTDDLADIFSAADSFMLNGQPQSADLDPNPDFDGDMDINLLAGDETLEAGEEGAVSFDVILWPGGSIDSAFINVVFASAIAPGDTMLVDTAMADTLNFDVQPCLNTNKYTTGPSTNNGDGSWTVEYTVEVENCGNVDIDSLQILDDLATAFADADTFFVNGSPQGGDLLVNPDFDGNTDMNLLPGDETLQPGDNGSVTFTVVFFPGNPTGDLYANTAITSGITPTDSMLVDTMTSDTLDLMLMPCLSTNKYTTGPASNNGDGSWTVEYTVEVENCGNINIDSLQILDDLATAFADADTFYVNGVPQGGDLVVNPDFDGNMDMNLLTGTETLEPDDAGSVTFTVVFVPGDPTGDVYANTAITSGITPTDSMLVDTMTSDTLDLMLMPCLSTNKYTTGPASNNGDGSWTVEYTVEVENCGNINIDSLQILDDLATAFADADTFYVNGVPQGGDLLVNPDFDGNMDMNLLTGTETLEPDDAGSVTFTVVFVPGDPTGDVYANTAITSGITPTDSMLVDTMTSDTLDLMLMPCLSTNKYTTGPASNNGDGSWTVEYTVEVENCGNINIDSLQILDDLATAFADADTFYVNGVPQGGDLLVNPDFDGNMDMNLLTGTETLEPDDAGSVTFTVVFVPGDPTGDVYANTAITSGITPTDSMLVDTMTSDTLDLMDMPCLSTNKYTTGPATNNGDGSWTVEYTVEVENCGNINIDSLQILDDLATAFADADTFYVNGVPQGGDLLVNPDFDGNMDMNLLTGTETLEPDDAGSVTFTVVFVPGDPMGDVYANTAITSGITPTDSMLVDTMTSDTLDLMDMPCLNTNKYTTGPATNNGDGSWTVEYTVEVENCGNINIDSLQILDDLATAFADADTFYVNGVPQGGDLLVNPDFDGNMDMNLLTGTETLEPDDAGSVTFTVVFVPGDPMGDVYANTAITSGITPTDSMLVDTMTSDTLDLMDMPCLSTNKYTTGPATNNGDGSWTVEYTVEVENCGNINIDSLQILDDLATAFADADTFYVNGVPQGGDLLVNPDFDGNMDMNLLTGTETLEPDDAGSVTFTVVFVPGDPTGDVYANTAITSGITPTDSMLVDTMTSDTLDLMDMPCLSTNKYTTGPATNNGDGSWTVEYTVEVENCGNINIDSLQILDDLATAFADADTFYVNGVPQGGDLLVNPDFDGNMDMNLLTGTETLEPDDAGSVTFTVVFVPGDPMGDVYANTAITSGYHTDG